ncbi:hypothetical protein [Companilactobacillus mishanensis]|uniref:hypothetical protein n=1 Tax=Companilactobacillus mishanensis TaxID=2486008 RepID=UPI001295F7DA|nr:hypothetical protein [Companilactobacillus mishanensis]MQS89253.1 hypothetical protein [Companilactobacillus mishanensis]
MKKSLISAFAGLLIASTIGVVTPTLAKADTSTKTPLVQTTITVPLSIDGDQFIHFMIKKDIPVYSAKGMDLKMFAPVGNKSYDVSTDNIIKQADGSYLYPINDENQYVKSTDVEQAMNGEIPTKYIVSSFEDIIHTKNLIGIPLYDKNLNIIEYAALPADSYWYTNGSIFNQNTNELFYRVSTNEYVSSVDITTK